MERRHLIQASLCAMAGVAAGYPSRTRQAVPPRIGMPVKGGSGPFQDAWLCTFAVEPRFAEDQPEPVPPLRQLAAEGKGLPEPKAKEA